MTMLPKHIELSDLRARPEFIEPIADRMWHAWWRSSGAALETVKTHLDDFLAASSSPRGVVAHDNRHYVGSTLLIDDDLSERLQYAPWIAALWVEPGYREDAIGAAMIDWGVETAFSLASERSTSVPSQPCMSSTRN